MRPRDAIAVAALACLLVSGCSRLTFVKPSADRGDYEQVTPDFEAHQSADDKRRVAMLDTLGLAGVALQRGDLDAAEKQARAAQKIDPKSADPYTVLAVIADRRGQGEAAGGYYAKAVQLAPGSGMALNNYGTWLCSHGRTADSLAQFDAAIKDPDYTTPDVAIGNAGACALRAGQVDRAAMNLQRALQLNPANAVALAAMAQLRYDQGQYLDARAFIQRRLVAAPANQDALELAARIEDKMGDADAAARYRQLMTGQSSPQGNGDQNGARNQ